MMPLPYFIAVADGSNIRTIHPPALGEHRAAVEGALKAVLLRDGHDAHTLAATEGKAQNDVLHQAVEELTGTPAITRPATVDMLTQGEIARTQGFTGDCCAGCGGFSMRRNGTCLLCVECGATTGCS